MVAGANNIPAVLSPVGANPAPDAAPVGGHGGQHGGAGIGNKNNTNAPLKGKYEPNSPATQWR